MITGVKKEFNYLKVIRQFHDQYRVNMLPEIGVNENTLHTYTRI